MGEIVGIDGRIGSGIFRYNVNTATREWMLEYCEHGKVVAWIVDRIQAEEETRFVSMFGNHTGWKMDFL